MTERRQQDDFWVLTFTIWSKGEFGFVPRVCRTDGGYEAEQNCTESRCSDMHHFSRSRILGQVGQPIDYVPLMVPVEKKQHRQSADLSFSNV